MSAPRLLLLSLIVIFIFIKGCSTIKHSDYVKKVRAYIDQFDKNLASSDEVILKQFLVNRSNDAILKAIRIMQNRDMSKDSIVCSVNFENASIILEDANIRVEISAKLQSMDPTIILNKETRFTLWLTSDDGDLVITNIEADQFYRDYKDVCHALINHKNREKDIASKKIFFDQARTLQQTYDTVIWYTQYQDSIYYYVVNGSWRNYFIEEGDPSPDSTSRMGLVSETGRVVVPPAYDLVGTIGFEKQGVIEVKKDGRVGHYGIDGKQIAPAVYDWIIPYSDDNAHALVKQDSVHGWLDESFTYHSGFPSVNAEKYVKEYGYLGKQIVISNTTTAMTEILNLDNMGYGIVMPPTHFVNAGVFREVITDIYMGENSFGWGGTESIETEGSLFEKISDRFSAFMVMLNDHYLEGREGFYERTKLNFVDNKNRSLGIYDLVRGSITFNKIDSALLEVRISKPDDEDEYETDEYDWYVQYFRYFSLDGGTITELESNRNYGFTQFVKIDSAYLTGSFSYRDEETGLISTSSFLPASDLEHMRNEILAEYGYIFTDEKTSANFRYRQSYKARYSNYEDFIDQMTEVDRHNLEFLESLIGTLRNKNAA